MDVINVHVEDNEIGVQENFEANVIDVEDNSR